MSRSHVLDRELKIQIPSLEPQSAQMSGDCTVSTDRPAVRHPPRERAEECGELKGK